MKKFFAECFKYRFNFFLTLTILLTIFLMTFFGFIINADWEDLESKDLFYLTLFLGFLLCFFRGFALDNIIPRTKGKLLTSGLGRVKVQVFTSNSARVEKHSPEKLANNNINIRKLKQEIMLKKPPKPLKSK